MKQVNEIMKPKDDIYSKERTESREVFRNRYLTNLSPVMICATIFQLVVGLILLALSLLAVISGARLLIYFISGFDLLNFKIGNDPPSAGEVIGALVIILVFGLASAGYLGAVRRRLFSRLYVLAGKPLATVAGHPRFNHFEEFSGFKIGERYFDLQDDCWLTEADLEKLRQIEADLDKLGRAGGEMRVWYVSSTGVLVRAEWQPA